MVIVFVCVTLGCTGCGVDPLDPNVYSGVIDARVQDDPVPYPDVATDPGRAGTVTVDMMISLQRRDGTWHDLGLMTTKIVDLQASADSPLHGPQWLPAGWYQAMRVTMASAQVNLAASPSVSVSFPAGPLEMLFDIPDFRLTQDETTFLMVVLNVESWTDWSVSTVMPPSYSDVLQYVEAFVSGVTP